MIPPVRGLTGTGETIIPQRNDLDRARARAQARLANLDDGLVPRKRAGVNGVLTAIGGFAVAMLLWILADLYFNAGGNLQFVQGLMKPTPKIADKLKPEIVVEHGDPPKEALSAMRAP